VSILLNHTLIKLPGESARLFQPVERGSQPGQDLLNPASLLDRLERGIAIAGSADSAENWELRKIDHITNESGINPQLRVFLKKGSFQIFGRLKYCSNLNEAIVYEKMRASKDPLTPFVPKYLGVLDSKGNLINLSAEIDMHGEEAVRNKYKPAYMILGDLLKEIERDGTKIHGNAQDFKFARPSLLDNDDEIAKHGHQEQRSSLYKWFRAKFLGMSNCSFAHQGNTKESWGIWLINRIRRLISILKTKNELRRNVNRMGPLELLSTMRSLNNLKKSPARVKFYISRF
jgi:hypothetical protein